MDLEENLQKEIVQTSAIFLACLIILSGVFFILDSKTTSLISESQKSANAIEYNLLTIIEENIILIEYLNTPTYEETIELDKKILEFDNSFLEIDETMQSLLISGEISNKKLITDYQSSQDVRDELERLRNEIIALHKEELATNHDKTTEKNGLIQTHQTYSQESIQTLAVSIKEINESITSLQEKVSKRLQLYLLLIILLSIFYTYMLIRKTKHTSKDISNSIKNISTVLQEYSEGNKSARCNPRESRDLNELKNLDHNINLFLSSLDSPTIKQKLNQDLLTKESHQIIDFIKQNSNQKKQTTITDLKKYLGVTHPTVLLRIKTLTEEKYVEIIKKGRQKFLKLTEKSYRI